MIFEVLITRPDYDPATSSMAKLTTEIVTFCETNGIGCIDLFGPKANKKEFDSRLKSQNPRFIILNGHGNDKCIFGYNNEPLVECDKDEVILRNKIVYMIACQSAELCQKCTTASTGAYVGYLLPVVIPYTPEYSSVPEKDEVAKSFFIASNLVATTVLKGNTIKEAHTRSQNEFQRQIDYYNAQPTIEAPHIVTWLRLNKSSQKLFGNENARLR